MADKQLFNERIRGYNRFELIGRINRRLDQIEDWEKIASIYVHVVKKVGGK